MALQHHGSNWGYTGHCKQDAIFRIASMTKPVTSLAVMMLAEQGALQIAHPASRYLPEFKDLQVGVEKKGADGKTELAARL